MHIDKSLAAVTTVTNVQGVLPESGAPSSLGSDNDEEAPVFKKINEAGEKVFLISHNNVVQYQSCYLSQQ